VPRAWRTRIGQPCLWAWIDSQKAPLTDEQFYGHWRGWLALDPNWADFIWDNLAPAEWRDVDPIAPPPGCRWITEPLPGATPEAEE
jgi:hypothetical protein